MSQSKARASRQGASPEQPAKANTRKRPTAAEQRAKAEADAQAQAAATSPEQQTLNAIIVHRVTGQDGQPQIAPQLSGNVTKFEAETILDLAIDIVREDLKLPKRK